MKTTALLGTLLFGLSLGSTQAQTVFPVTEDVMTSSFFQGANTVRGYAAETNRPVMRVSTDNPVGIPGAETIYLSFDHDFSSFTGPVTASLTVQSTAGGFGLDASASAPFTVSAHAVNANPLTSIIDDTNSGGTTDWLNFYNQNLLAADSAALTAVNCVDCAVSFDVSAIVNSWISGSNGYQFIALTGRNEVAGSDFLHGFVNNNNAGALQGATFLTVAAVPEPETYALLLAGLGLIGARLRRRAGSQQG